MEDKQTILIVDDLRTNALALGKILESEWTIRTAASGEEALQAATLAPIPDIILLDVRMPEMDGYDVCKKLKASKVTCDIPVIFITAMNAERDEEYGLSLGAVDYIIKPVNSPIVKARIRNHIALRQALAELEFKNKELQRLASRDKLTGLYNRRKLDEKFEQEVLRANRYDRPLSVILMDIDHFKNVNDTHGHPVGDRVLSQTATLLEKVLRASDIFGRWGGEEFLILCPETDLTTATELAERLRARYAEEPFPASQTLTSSFGVSTHRQGLETADILNATDQALYRAKHGGRNQVQQEEN